MISQNLLQNKTESIQYNKSLAITGAIRKTSKERLHIELGLESFQHSRWYRKRFCFYNITVNKSPIYLAKLFPSNNTIYNIRNNNNITLMNFKQNFFRIFFFPSIIIEWNILDPKSPNLPSYKSFKENILKFIRPVPNSVFECGNPEGIKYHTRLQLNFSHFCNHKFKHSFQNTLNPLCTCSLEAETSSHFILQCPYY